MASEALIQARRAQGDRTRQLILEAAVNIASAEGLEGLTIGRLAAITGMSKSGLFAHFGSKEELQLATIEAAREIFIERVMRPALAAEKGLPRLYKLCEVWLDYASGSVFQGGCFFFAASAEFDGRPGAVRDRIAEIMQEWLGVLERSVREAQQAGDLDESIEAAQLAFEINALELGANWAFQLYGDKQAFARTRESIFRRLSELARPASLPEPHSGRQARKGRRTAKAG